MPQKNTISVEYKIIPSLLKNIPKEINEPKEKHFWQYCVNCNNQLQSRKCKLICPHCGFYHSCSEP